MYSYTGDVKKLKSLGYEFKKLFASNHKSYSLNNIAMFVISKMGIEISNLDDEYQETFVKFIIDNKDQDSSFWFEDRMVGELRYDNAPKWYFTGKGNIVSKDDFFSLKRKFMNVIKDINKKTEDENCELSSNEVETLFEEAEKMEGASEGYRFKIDLVSQIIALDNLNPLELIDLQ